MTKVAPYGTWTSPITAERIARGSVTLAEPSLANQFVYWVEGRPSEGGRQALVRAALDGTGREDVTPEEFSARTRVHEYGGGAYAPLPGGGVVFSGDVDGRAYASSAHPPVALTPEPDSPRSLRYADFGPSPDGERIFTVRESHQGDGEAVNEI